MHSEKGQATFELGSGQRRRASEEAGSWRGRDSEEAGSWRGRASEKEAGSWRGRTHRTRTSETETGSWRRRTSETETGSWRRRCTWVYPSGALQLRLVSPSSACAARVRLPYLSAHVGRSSTCVP